MKTKFVLSLASAFFGILASGFFAQAAPMPATSTSKLVAPQLGIFRSAAGFQLSSGESGWEHVQAPKNNKFIATVYRAPKSADANTGAKNASQKNAGQKKAGAKGANKNDASLTVRVDELKKDTTLDKYIQRWKKEYPKYGFDVLNSRAFTENKQRGYFLDLVNRDSGKQLRQVVFLKNQRAAILTCRDNTKSFQDTLKSCNQIIRTFKWVE